MQCHRLCFLALTYYMKRSITHSKPHFHFHQNKLHQSSPQRSLFEKENQKYVGKQLHNMSSYKQLNLPLISSTVFLTSVVICYRD
ncbi:hypothetical protein Hanom_Chr07g00681001 [Helianthus anomalus]